MDFRVPYFWRNPYEKKMNLIPKKTCLYQNPICLAKIRVAQNTWIASTAVLAL
jgi:hypothetical protein